MCGELRSGSDCSPTGRVNQLAGCCTGRRHALLVLQQLLELMSRLQLVLKLLSLLEQFVLLKILLAERSLFQLLSRVQLLKLLEVGANRGASAVCR